MLRSLSLLTLAAVLFSAGSASAQIDISSLMLGAGSFSAPKKDLFHPGSLHPEMEIGGRLLLPRLHWGLSWTYWNDRALTPPPVVDLMSWDSYRSHILGMRVSYRPFGEWNGPFALGLVGGVSRHFVSSESINPDLLKHSLSGVFRKTGNTLDLGLHLDLRLWKSLALRTQALHHAPLDSGDSGLEKQWTYSAGVVLSR
ncbi:MAG: hypothetical protein ACYC9O_09180 [Candidatus Latescibacterota bacterium]